MRVFVLSTGRCGTLTFSVACVYMTNFTVMHERHRHTSELLSLDYPDNHIEVNNRLSWVLPLLDEIYSDAFYVHLIRDKRPTVDSLLRRAFGSNGVCFKYSRLLSISKEKDKDQKRKVCEAYYDTVNGQIRWFLADKEHITVRLEDPKHSFREFWGRIGAQGDLDAALAEWDVKRN